MLRREGIRAYLKTPQIVVCGDQSSGKSSLLESIAHVPFPMSSGVVTTFVTDLDLRHGSSDLVFTTIRPSQSRTAKQQGKLLEFRHTAKKLDRDGFKNLFALAYDQLGAVETQGFHHADTLSISVCGPTQPHLTLIVSSQWFHVLDLILIGNFLGSARADLHAYGISQFRRCRRCP